MRGQPVPFRGKEQVLEAYSANGIWPWAIFAGKELFVACEDDDEAIATNQLEQTLKMLQKGGSEGIYSLRVYKNIPASGIDYGTKPSRGFNFKLYEEDGSPWSRDQRMIAELRERNEKLEAALLEQDEEDEEEKPGGIMGVINGFLAIPEIKQAAVGWIVGTVGKYVTMNKTAQVAGIPGQTASASQEQIEKAENALDVLITKDPMIGDHLAAIAKIAAENPGLYNTLIGMIPKG